MQLFFYPVLNLPRQRCVLLRYDKKENSPSLEFATVDGGKRSKNKIGAKVFLYMVINYKWWIFSGYPWNFSLNKDDGTMKVFL